MKGDISLPTAVQSMTPSEIGICQSIADTQGFELYRHYTETQAAETGRLFWGSYCRLSHKTYSTMSRYKIREFQLGDYWLSKIKSSPSYYRTWLDKKTRQTRRTSLRTTDFEEAKQIFTEWFINNQRPQQAEPEDVSIASVLSSYYENHGKNLASSDQVLIASRQWLDFFGEAGVNVLFSVREQEKFHEYLRDRGQVNTTINRNLSVG